MFPVCKYTLRILNEFQISKAFAWHDQPTMQGMVSVGARFASAGKNTGKMPVPPNYSDGFDHGRKPCA